MCFQTVTKTFYLLIPKFDQEKGYRRIWEVFSAVGDHRRQFNEWKKFEIMGKPTKPKLEVLKEERRKSVIPRLFDEIDGMNCHSVAIGLDMAASEENWGLSVISLDKTCSSGQLNLLMPYRETLEGFKNECSVKPSYIYLEQLLAGLKERNLLTAIAVDIPLGWPDAHQC